MHHYGLVPICEAPKFDCRGTSLLAEDILFPYTVNVINREMDNFYPKFSLACYSR